jgi:hypothetical protein
MAKNFHNGTNTIAKHDTIFLGEEILVFFMAPVVKTHLCPGAEDSSPLTWSDKCE